MFRILVLFASVGMVVCGCGAGAPQCESNLVTSVGPANATADHVAKAPVNQQRFLEFAAYVGSTPGCVYQALSFTEQADWTVSDPVHVFIRSAKEEANALATLARRRAR